MQRGDVEVGDQDKMVVAEGQVQNDEEDLEEVTVGHEKHKFHCEVCNMSYDQRTGLARHNTQRHTDDFTRWDCEDFECSYTTSILN